MKKKDNNNVENNSEYMKYVITMPKKMHRSLKILSLYYNIDIKDIVISAIDKELDIYEKKVPEIFSFVKKVEKRNFDI